MPAAVTLSEAIQEYLDVLDARGQAKSTLAARRSALMRFLAVVGNIHPRNLGTHHVDAFLIKHKHWEPATKKINITYLSTFQNWLHTRKYLDRGVDILEGRRKVRVPRKRKPRISVDRFDDLLGSAPTGRDRILLALGLHTMARASEIVIIQWKHVDLDDDWLQVYRLKTGEYDTLPISGELHDELVRWRVEVCRSLNVIKPNPEWFVACALERTKIRGHHGRYTKTPGPLRLIPGRPLLSPLKRVKDLLVAAGAEGEGVGMHTLRRSGAQALLEAIEAGRHDESAIRVVQSMLGHSNIRTTEIYLDRDVDKARRDTLIRGKLLYGKTVDGEVIPLRTGEGTG